MKVELTPEQRERYRVLHRKTNDRKVGDRIKAVLLADRGYTQREIAEILMVDEDTVGRWLKKALENPSSNHWIYLSSGGYEGKLTPVEWQRLYAWLAAKDWVRSAQDVQAYVVEHLGKSYSVSGVYAILAHSGWVYQKPQVVLPVPDVARQKAWIEETQACEGVVVYADAAHPQHRTQTGRVWMKKEDPVVLPATAGRQRVNLLGGYNIATQHMTLTTPETVNAKAVCEWLKRLSTVYAQEPRVTVVVDNARYFHARIVREWLANQSKITLRFLPPYCPHLNHVERVWAYMKEQVLTNRYYASFQAFQGALQHFFTHFERHAATLAHRITGRFRILSPAL
jgi:transposase